LVENIATENLETSLQISQLVELGGKRGRRVSLAQAERETANWSFESTRADVVALTARRFVDALAAQERISIERELVNVAQETAEAVSMRVRAGGASSVEATRAQVALVNARAALASAEHERSVAHRRLASMWANPKPRFSEVRGDLTSTPAPLALDTLLARIDRNPDVARWAAEISRHERLHDSVRASRVPDLDLDFGVRRLGASEETGLLIGASIPIPIFDRAQDATAAAELRIRGANEQQAAARAQASAAVAVAHAELAAALDAHQRLQNEVLPQATSAHEAATSAYRSGLLRFTDVLDVHRTLFEVRIRSIDMLVRYHTAAFEIERLTGSPVTGPSDKEQQ
jgi:cobalt-zinc-cadmium efflux system outer membrane protein